MTQDVATGLKCYLAFLFSTTVHEAAHAWTALKLGDDTAHRGGQVSLDPTPHIRRAPVGMVLVPMLSYFLGGWMIGWASAAANLALFLVAALLIRAGLAAHFFAAPDWINFSHVTDPAAPGLWLFAAAMLSIFFSLNLLLLVFNLIPLPPLDGSGIFMLVCPAAWVNTLMNIRRHPGFNYIGIFVAWQVIGWIYRPIQLFAVNMLYPGSYYN